MCPSTPFPHPQKDHQRLQHMMRELQQQILDAMKNLLAGSFTLKPQELVNLFCDYVGAELKLYKWWRLVAFPHSEHVNWDLISVLQRVLCVNLIWGPRTTSLVPTAAMILTSYSYPSIVCWWDDVDQSCLLNLEAIRSLWGQEPVSLSSHTLGRIAWIQYMCKLLDWKKRNQTAFAAVSLEGL